MIEKIIIGAISNCLLIVTSFVLGFCFSKYVLLKAKEGDTFLLELIQQSHEIAEKIFKGGRR